MELPALAEEQALVGDLLREALAEAVLVAREQVLAVEDAAALEVGELAGTSMPSSSSKSRQLLAMELATEHDATCTTRFGCGPRRSSRAAITSSTRPGDAHLVDGSREAAGAVVRPTR